jgi:hypothetical protein
MAKEEKPMPHYEGKAVSPREMLEPCAVRAARTVLRGGRWSDTPPLPDPWEKPVQINRLIKSSYSLPCLLVPNGKRICALHLFPLQR